MVLIGVVGAPASVQAAEIVYLANNYSGPFGGETGYVSGPGRGGVMSTNGGWGRIHAVAGCSRAFAANTGLSAVEIFDTNTRNRVGSVPLPSYGLDVASNLSCSYALALYGNSDELAIIDVVGRRTTQVGINASTYVNGSAPRFDSLSTDPVTGRIYAIVNDFGTDCSSLQQNGCSPWVPVWWCSQMLASCEQRGWPATAAPHIVTFELSSGGQLRVVAVAGIGQKYDDIYGGNGYDGTIAIQHRSGGSTYTARAVTFTGAPVASFPSNFNDYRQFFFVASKNRVLIYGDAGIYDWNLLSNTRTLTSYSSIGTPLTPHFADVDERGQSLWLADWNGTNGVISKVDIATMRNQHTYALANNVIPRALGAVASVPQTVCRSVTGDRAGTGTHANAFDGNPATGFASSHMNWQHVECDLGRDVWFEGIRRMMTRDGVDTSGTRGQQGEAVWFRSASGSWTRVTSCSTSGPGAASSSAGWQPQCGGSPYVSYGNGNGWHSVEYGWSDPLMLRTRQRARYIRFGWDGNEWATSERGSETLNEVEIIFSP